ncbi:MAG: alpha-hydroxy-acid oxidizing protein [Chloroflexi bacterium]|nr:MAG: alpha-hydroxy-acid oxidizing protein [Chloroflexota bacterium]
MPEMSPPFGPAAQGEIYVGSADDLALDPDEWESRAKAVLEPGPFDYIAGGAGGESTMQANRDAFTRWRLRPAMLAGNQQRDLHVSVLGTSSPAPYFLAPVGVLSAARPDGDLSVARAAAVAGVPWVVSTAASTPMETIADAMGAAPRWYQLYWVNDREVVTSLVQRAEAAGYAAIVLTLDTLQLGWRVRDLRNRYLPFILGEGIGQFTSDPVFRSRLSVPPEEDPRGAGAAMVAMFSNLGLRWDDLSWLRERTRLPLLAKGVLRGDDARRVLDAGFQGVIVSNHGGRQVDGAIAALDALVEVRDALGADAVVLMDSGIRRGADVIKALALGANAVLLGRPYVYALAVAGQAGVERVVRNLTAEIDLTLALAGGRDVKALDRSWVTQRA